MKRTIITTLLALVIGSTAALASEPVTVLYKNNPDIVSYEQLNP